MKANMIKKQQGFTLIELVVVIVILGVLAVSAAPKFINLQADAKEATLDAVKASVETAMSIVHAKSLIAGNENTAAGANVDVTIDAAGTKIELDYGYPDGTIVNLTDLLDINVDDFTTILSGGLVYIYPTGGTIPASTTPGSTDKCSVRYTEASSATVKATVVVVPGCS